jgi:hypothetical protein
MPFCPQCHYEYMDDVKVCPDCKLKLVVKLPPEMGPKPDIDLVPLHPLPGHIYGEMVKEALEKAGIYCVLISDPLSIGLLTKGANGVGQECQILVDKKEKNRAESILHMMMDHI